MAFYSKRTFIIIIDFPTYFALSLSLIPPLYFSGYSSSLQLIFSRCSIPLPPARPARSPYETMGNKTRAPWHLSCLTNFALGQLQLQQTPTPTQTLTPTQMPTATQTIEPHPPSPSAAVVVHGIKARLIAVFGFRTNAAALACVQSRTVFWLLFFLASFLTILS